MEDGCERFLVITTKPENYIRKPAKKPIVTLMKLMYPQCDQISKEAKEIVERLGKQISKDYEIRHLNYNRQIELIKDLSEQKKAVFAFPSEESEVTRLGGTKQQLNKLFELGYSDMENRKQKLFELLND